MENLFIEPTVHEWPGLQARQMLNNDSLEAIVQPVLEAVKNYGDEAVIRYNRQFGGYAGRQLLVSNEELEMAAAGLTGELKKAILLAKKNIELFHQGQVETIRKIETMPGTVCWRKPVAIENVGLYIPGGTAPLFSTLLMLAIPAKIAGCKNIIVCTPAAENGTVHPAILFTAKITGINTIYKAGGAQAIAAMAYGTSTIQKCDKLFGPGNQYVTCAKQLVSRQTAAIDMPAGPSEVAIYADESCVPGFVAADLLSQAEHGADSQVVLVASHAAICEKVMAALRSQLEQLPRKEIAAAALKCSRFVVLNDVNQAFRFLNAYAPEHLIIASDNAAVLSEQVINAGSVFLGNYSPEAAGDYASGTNHTLPTNGNTRAYSGISVDSFVKKITFQQLSKEGLQQIGKSVELMAAAEGLTAHKNAITIRLNEQYD